MNILVKKMSHLGILKAEMIFGAILMAAAMIGLPVSILVGDASLITNPYIILVLLVGMLMFGSFAYFLFMRPYIMYHKQPEVLAETDGEFLYIHGKKEAKIPLPDVEGATIFVSLPFIYSSEFLAVLVVHLCSEKYGDLVLDVPGHGSFKLRFVSNVRATADELTRYLCCSLEDDSSL